MMKRALRGAKSAMLFDKLKAPRRFPAGRFNEIMIYFLKLSFSDTLRLNTRWSARQSLLSMQK